MAGVLDASRLFCKNHFYYNFIDCFKLSTYPCSRRGRRTRRARQRRRGACRRGGAGQGSCGRGSRRRGGARRHRRSGQLVGRAHELDGPRRCQARGDVAQLVPVHVPLLFHDGELVLGLVQPALALLELSLLGRGRDQTAL